MVDPNQNLRDLLATTGGIAQASQGLVGASNNLRQQAAQQQFNQQAPDLLNNPTQTNLNQLALLKSQAGDDSLLNIQGQTAQKIAVKKLGLDSDDGDQVADADTVQKLRPGTSRSMAQGYEDANYSIEDAIKSIDKLREVQISAQKGDASSDANSTKRADAQRKSFVQMATKTEDDADNDIQLGKKALSQLSSGTTVGDPLALTAAYKLATHNTRAPSIQIMGQQIASTLGGTAQQWSNVFTGGDMSTLTPQLRQGLAQAIQKSVDSADQYKQQRVLKIANNVQGMFPALVQDGSPDQAIQDFADRNNLTASVDKNGKLGFNTPQKKSTIQSAGDDQITPLAKMINTIPDPAHKQSAVKALSTYNQKSMTADQVNAFKARIQQLGGAAQ